MEFQHVSVLYKESIAALDVRDNGIYVDGTLGGGGHSYGILSVSDTCRLIGIDQDSEAIAAAKKRLQKFGERFTAVNSNFREIKRVLDELGVEEIDGALLDIGVSSY